MAIPHMKSIIAFALGIAIATAMVATNPSMEDYSNFLGHKYVHSAKNQDDITRGFALILGGLAGSVLSTQTTRKNYLLFSTYETDTGSKKLLYVGIFKNFINLEETRDQPGQGGN